jgi:predicted esterase
MRKLYMLVLWCMLAPFVLHAQVKSNYIYSTSMPYGTLDIRTTISSTNYYYLQEGQTFAFRESSPGVRTNAYLDMTSDWDSSPYKQGNLRQKNGSADKFVMNYRLLLPQKYNSTYAPGYPIMLLLHGAVERGNCYYNNCYHADWSYDPNVNKPAAPTSSTHKLLNNDANLTMGGKTHLDAVNKAAGKLPNDPTVTGRMFPGFVLVPQMFNEWDSLNVQDAIRLVQLIAKKYNIDENRIYVHGLSIGGYAVYEAMKRAPWLFAAAQPMSAVRDASIRKYNLTSKVIHIPTWIFQGGTDTAPSPTYTNKLVSDYNNAGAVMRYTVYSGVGHTCWYKAFAEPDFYSWLLSKNKANIHVYKGITTINTSKAQYPKLILAEGFFAYQWEKDGVIISGATANTYVAKAPGKYRARFSRVSAPTASQWNVWSAYVTVTYATSTARMSTSGDSLQITLEEENFSLDVYPNPSRPGSVKFVIRSSDHTNAGLTLTDHLGKVIYKKEDLDLSENEIEVHPQLREDLPAGIYFASVRQGTQMLIKKVLIESN